jgi:hypothetical protein
MAAFLTTDVLQVHIADIMLIFRPALTPWCNRSQHPMNAPRDDPARSTTRPEARFTREVSQEVADRNPAGRIQATRRPRWRKEHSAPASRVQRDLRTDHKNCFGKKATGREMRVGSTVAATIDRAIESIVTADPVRCWRAP